MRIKIATAITTKNILPSTFSNLAKFQKWDKGIPIFLLSKKLLKTSNWKLYPLMANGQDASHIHKGFLQQNANQHDGLVLWFLNQLMLDKMLSKNLISMQGYNIGTLAPNLPTSDPSGTKGVWLETKLCRIHLWKNCFPDFDSGPVLGLH